MALELMCSLHISMYSDLQSYCSCMYYKSQPSCEIKFILPLGRQCEVIMYTERKKKRRVEFFPSYFNHFLRRLL